MASMTKAKQSRVRLKARACNYLSPFALKKKSLRCPISRPWHSEETKLTIQQEISHQNCCIQNDASEIMLLWVSAYLCVC